MKEKVLCDAVAAGILIHSVHPTPVAGSQQNFGKVSDESLNDTVNNTL